MAVRLMKIMRPAFVALRQERRGSGVLLARRSSQQTLDRSRFWLVMLMCGFTLCFLAIAVRVVDVAIPEEGGVSELFARALHPAGTAGYADVGFMKLVTGEGLKEALAAHQEENAWKNTVVLPRADIVDRNGVVLATSLEAASLFATTKELREPAEVAELLAQVLPDVDAKTLAAQFASGRRFVWIKRNLTPKQQYDVNKLGIPGLYFQKEYVRVYPQGNLLSHVLGFVGMDNNGLAGVEKFFDKQLRDTQNSEPLHLAIDVRVQNLMYDQLFSAMTEFKAIGATGIVANVRTGEVVSMVNLPDFDPNKPAPDKSLSRFNRASLGAYEMGSTFKTFTTAMALDLGTVDMHGGYDATNPIRVARFTIKDSHPKNRWLSVPEIYAYSSNIGTVRMVMDVGMEKQQEYLRKLGMMKPVDIELPERARPLVPNPWREISMMTVSFGHGMSVSPLHLVQGVITTIGDGTRKELSLVKGGKHQKVAGERVFKPETVRDVRRLMRTVVQYGTGKKAEADGYRVGGKTGTAEKTSGGHYNEKAMLSSFVGAFPMDDPQYVVLVMLDEPKGDASTFNFATGGMVAAPSVSRVIGQMAPMLGMAPVFEMPADAMDAFWQDQLGIPRPNGGSKIHAARY
jgi:cell division protein FtsI (penicillin-binding protein 3)